MQMVITIANPFNNQKVRVNALYDTGCNRTAVSEKIINMWKMPCREDWLTINGTQNSSFKVRAKWTDLIFQNDNGSVSMKTNVSCIKSPIGDKYNPIDWNYHKHKFPHLKDLSFVDLEAPLDGELFPVLIGTDLIDLIRLDFDTESVPQRVGKKLEQNQPLAIKTKFGWLAAGNSCSLYEGNVNSSDIKLAMTSLLSHDRLNNSSEVMNAQATKYESEFPIGSEAIKNSVLVDDLLESTPRR